MKEQPATYYDRLYCADNTICAKYFKLWKALAKYLVSRDVKSVLDIGCGLGGFGSMLGPDIEYSGFDFSSVAVSECVSKGLNVWNGDATDITNYGKYGAYVSTEVLEHVMADFDVINNIPLSSVFCFSVPSFKHESHVRHFKTEHKIRTRYNKLVDIRQITKYKNRFLCFGVRI